MFFNIIFNDIVPIFVVMALGYAGAKMNAFTPSQTQALNKVVLNFALPAALFVSITKATRAMLFEDLTLTLVSLIGIVALFFVCYWVCRKVFHHTAAEAAVCGLTAGSPTIGFLGFAVLDPIYGATTQTGLVVAIVAIVANAVIIPIWHVLDELSRGYGIRKRLFFRNRLCHFKCRQATGRLVSDACGRNCLIRDQASDRGLSFL